MRIALRLAAVGAIVAGTVLLPATAALADPPEKTGWWNRVSAGGVAAPMPTTPEGDLKVTNAPDGPAAYSAVLYSSAGATDATLTLAVRADRTLGTPDVLACVTADTQWPEGGNQPFDLAPEYDCDAGSAFGELATDGSTLTFLLDASTQDAAGAWSLALVPTPGGTTPFNLELAQPEADAFVPGPAESSQQPFAPADPGGFSEQDGTVGGGGGDAFFPGGFAEPPPVFDPGVVEQPLLAGGGGIALPEAAASAPEPALADPVTPGTSAPVVFAQPAGVVEDLGTGRRLVALLVLAGGSAAVGYAAGQQQPAPRLIGGRARAVGASAPVTAVPAAAPRQERARGIGRFAKERAGEPRRLR